MHQAQRYDVEQRTQGRNVVVRTGPLDGKRITNIYKDLDAAQEVADLLNRLKEREW